jgi:DNA replication protein DnaC
MPFAAGTIYWVGSPRPSAPAQLVEDAANRVAIAKMRESIERDVPVFFYGEVGCGKTTLMLQIFLEMSRREPAPTATTSRRFWLAEPNWWTTAEGYVADVRAGWNYGDRERGGFTGWGADYSADGIACRVKRLFLDEVGVESDHGSSNATEIVGKLLRDRYTANLPTWITTNLDPNAFTARYGERVMSRIGERSLVVGIAGSDRRIPLNRRSVRPVAS